MFDCVSFLVVEIPSIYYSFLSTSFLDFHRFSPSFLFSTTDAIYRIGVLSVDMHHDGRERGTSERECQSTVVGMLLAEDEQKKDTLKGKRHDR